MPRQPFFLDTPQGRRFALLSAPEGEPRALLLQLPPLAEELNKTRRALALAIQVFTQAGFAVLQLDLRGCGDSEGAFADAGWADWQADARAGADWLRARWPQRPLIGWGLRAGCLLHAAGDADAALWWQPTLKGATLWQQWLRMGAMAGDAGDAATALAALKARSAAGEVLEIAGYAWSPALVQGLAAAELAPPPGPLCWLEASPQAEPALLPVSGKWLAQHAPSAKAQAVHDAQPWATVELADSPGLTQASLAWLEATWPR